MLHKTEGIVIRTTDYGESNKILTVYTRENGKTALMARGAKRPKSRFASASQLFIYAVFVYQKSKGMGTLNSADLIDSFKYIRSDLFLTAHGAYMIELFDKMTDDGEKNPYLFELLYQLLHHLNEGEDGDVLSRILETKMLAVSGSPPVLHQCVNCGSAELPFKFSVRLGGALCLQCLNEDVYHLSPSPAVMKLLRLFQQINPGRIGRISLKDTTKKELKDLLELYYQEYVGIHIKSKRFLDQINNFNSGNIDS